MSLTVLISRCVPGLAFGPEVFPLIHGVRLAEVIFCQREMLEALTISGGILLVQSIILCGLAYYWVRRKLITQPP